MGVGEKVRLYVFISYVIQFCVLFPLHNSSQFKLLLQIESPNYSWPNVSLPLKNDTSSERLNNVTRSKRSEAAYDYYKDVDYYNYYDVEDPVSCTRSQ